MVQIHSSLLEPKTSDLCLEKGEQANSSNNNLPLNGQNSNENIFRNTDYLLKSTYFLHKDKFKSYLENKKLSKEYIKSIIIILENTLNLSFKTPVELKEKLNKVKNRKYRALALRNLFYFLEEYELLDDVTIYKLKSKVKITERSNIDSYVPLEDEITKFNSLVKDYDYLSYLFLRILLESGLRVTEVQHFIKEIDITKFEIEDEVVTYPLYYLRGTKSSYYLFISKKLYSLILESQKGLSKYNVEKLKTWIKRNNLLRLKYTRKYLFTKMIKVGISLEVANFIQGRVSQNIGFNHYLAKKEIAAKEYRKLLF